MKKILSVFLALSVMLTVLPFGLVTITANAEVVSGQTGDCTWTLDGDVLTVTGNGAMGEGMRWDSNITTAIISEGVTSIGAYSFYACTKLTNVIIAESVTEICDMAFSECYSLVDITIPKGVKTVSNGVFLGCSSLENVTILNKTLAIGNDAFYECSSIKKVVYAGDEADRKTMSIGYNNDSLTSANWTYGTCTNHVYDNVCDKDCNNCGEVRQVNHTFDDDNDTVCNICGDYRFEASGKTGDCDWYLYKNILLITGDGAMGDYGNTGVPWSRYAITEVIIENGVTNIGDEAFDGCYGLTSITIPDSVTNIGFYAFEDCTGLTSVTIGRGVKTIESGAFFLCDAIEEVHISDLKAWCEIDFEDNPTRHGAKLYLNGAELEGDVVIPEGTTSIGNYAFTNCYFITSISIPDSVQSIGICAFYACRSLTEIVLPENITEIPNCTFFDCRKLQNIIIKGKVTNVGTDAFENDYKLKNVYFAGSERDYILMNIATGNTPLFIADWVYDFTGDDIPTAHECKYGDWKIVTNATVDTDGLKVKECSCGDKIEEIIPRLLNFKSKTLALQSNISIIFRVDPVYFTTHGYTNPAVIFTLGGIEYTVSEYTVNGSGLYEFAFNGVAPHQMKDMVSAVLTADYNGTTYTSAPQEYSIFTYCNNQITKNYTNSAYAKIMALLVDILNYGSAAQTYQNYKTNNLANAELNAAQKSLGNQEVITYTDEKMLQNTLGDGAIADIKTVGLTLQDSVVMTFKFELLGGSTLDGLTAHIEAAGKKWEIDSAEFTYEKSSGRYVVNFNGLNPAQMREKVSIFLKKDGVIVSDTATYSVESYGLSTAAQGNAKLAALVEAMARYGRSAKAYNG